MQDRFGNLLKLLAKLEIIEDKTAHWLYNGGYNKFDY